MTEQVSFACANSFTLSCTAFGCIGAWCIVHFWLHCPSPSHVLSTRMPTTCSSITPIAPHAGLPFMHLLSSPPHPSTFLSACCVCHYDIRICFCVLHCHQCEDQASRLGPYIHS